MCRKGDVGEVEIRDGINWEIGIQKYNKMWKIFFFMYIN